MNDTSDPLAILDAIDRERGESAIGMIQANQVQRLRAEIVALRSARNECERQFQQQVAEVGRLLDQLRALKDRRAG